MTYAANHCYRTLAEDILALLDSRGIDAADLIGHSFGGAELSYLALHYPARVRRAVFLDGGWDFYAMYNAEAWWDGWPDVPMTSADSASPQAVASYFARTSGVLFPLNEVLAVNRFDGAGRLTALDPNVKDMFRTMIRPRLTPLAASEIAVPVLSVRALPERAEDFFGGYATYDSVNQGRADETFAKWVNVVVRESARFVESVPGAQELILRGAPHELPNVQPERFVPTVRAFLFE